MNVFLYQIKQAYLSLKKKPGFVISIVASMGITLGALLSVMTLAYVLLLSPLPYPEQDRLFQLEHKFMDGNDNSQGSFFTYFSAIELHQDKSIFSESALSYRAEQKLDSHPAQPILVSQYVTPEWFSLLAADMVLGRAFEESEKLNSYSAVAVISYQTWQKLYQGNKNILSEKINLAGKGYKIIGVLTPDFIEPKIAQGQLDTQIFLPWDFNPTSDERRNIMDGAHPSINFFGKLLAVSALELNEQTLTTFVDQSFQSKIIGIAPLKGFHIKMELRSLKSAILGDINQSIYLLLAGAIGLVVIALANIANLFISRTAEKLKDLAIRAAFGANKNQLFKVLLAETGLLMIIATLVALIITALSFVLLKQYLILHIPRIDELHLNIFTLGSAIVIGVAIALLFAFISVNMINYRYLNRSLQTSGKGSGTQVSKKLRQLLIVSQISIVIVLVFSNMSIFKQSIKVINQSIGFTTDNIKTLYLTNGNTTAESGVPIINEIGQALLQLPEVAAISHAYSPLDMFDTPVQYIEKTDENIFVESLPVDEKYFDFVNQQLLEGQDFSAADIVDNNPVIIINDVYAQKLAENGSAVGMQIKVNSERVATVIGVVQGIKMPGKTTVPMRSYYPWPKNKYRLRMLVKVKENQQLTDEEIIKVTKGISSQIGLWQTQSWQVQQQDLLFTQYITLITSAVLATISFVLATIGLYGIISYSTQLRRYELGTRLAIGAKGKQLIQLIIKDNSIPFIAGFAVSILMILTLLISFSNQLMAYFNSQLISIFMLTTVLVLTMSLFSCYWPLRQYLSKPVVHALRDNE